MLRVNVGLSRKLSRDFNSTGCSVNLDGEVTAPVSDSEAVIEQIKELFDVAEEALNQEIERIAAESAIAGRDDPSGQPASSEPPRAVGSEVLHAANGKGRGRDATEDPAATNKQINYLLTIGKRQQLTTAQLEGRIAEILGRPVGLYDLSKRSAGVVIEALVGNSTKANATAGA